MIGSHPPQQGPHARRTVQIVQDHELGYHIVGPLDLPGQQSENSERPYERRHLYTGLYAPATHHLGQMLGGFAVGAILTPLQQMVHEAAVYAPYPGMSHAVEIGYEPPLVWSKKSPVPLVNPRHTSRRPKGFGPPAPTPYPSRHRDSGPVATTRPQPQPSTPFGSALPQSHANRSAP